MRIKAARYTALQPSIKVVVRHFCSAALRHLVFSKSAALEMSVNIACENKASMGAWWCCRLSKSEEIRRQIVAA